MAEYVKMQGPAGFSYAGDVKQCDKAMNMMLKRGLAFVALSSLIVGVIKLLIDLLGDQTNKKHRNKMDQIKYQHECKKEEIKYSHECKIEDKKVSVELDIEKMDKEYDIWLKKHSYENPLTETESLNLSPEYSDCDFTGCSSVELFNRSSTKDKSNWIVDNYMKVGLVNLLVSGSGTGKSIMITQIALAVDKGSCPEFLPTGSCNSVKQHVIFYRIEDFDNELEGKYGAGLAFLESDIEWFVPENLPEKNLVGFIAHLKCVANTMTKDALVCIDPATKLDGYKHEAFIKGVEEAMAIAKERGVTLTIVAAIHLDEIKEWAVLTNGDIKGGDKAIQQAGSVTALLKESTGVNYRFLKSLKEPKGSPKPFNGEVLVCKLTEKLLDENNKYLHFQYIGVKEHNQALPKKPKAQEETSSTFEISEKYKRNQKLGEKEDDEIVRMLQENKEIEEIAIELKVCPKTIKNHIKNMQESGKLPKVA